MFRLFLALNIFFFNLYAQDCGFKSCQAKIKDSKSIIKNKLYIPISKHKRLVFSKTIPTSKILKYDPFLSLYLVEDKDGFKYPFSVKNTKNLSIASINKLHISKGRIVKKQIGLNNFASFSKKVSSPSLLLDSFCVINGIVTPDGIIDKKYIVRFLQVKKVLYADIGIRLKDLETKSIVDRVNPFIGSMFVKGDVILEFDGKKVKYSSVLMRSILFSKIGSKHSIKIKRDKKILNLKVYALKRYGGGYISDSFLESLGFYFDKQMKISKIDKKAEHYHLKKGDKFVKIVKNKLLFQRDGFDFFINKDSKP